MDPLLLNELGVVYYHEEQLEDAVHVFKQALEIAASVNAEPKAWISTRSNLGHAFRRLGLLQEALDQFDEVLRQGGKDANIFSAKGLVLLEMGDNRAATMALHEALAVSPQDPIATDLLGKAMDAVEEEPVFSKDEELDDARRIEELAGQLERAKGRKTKMRDRDMERMILDDDDED